MNIFAFENELKKHPNFSSLSLKEKEDKLRSLSDAIYMSSIRTGTDLCKVFRLIKSGAAFDTKAFSLDLRKRKQSNLFNYVDSSIISFAKLLFEKRGISTPNAASGKGELMLSFLSYDFKKPSRGDIVLFDKKIELKVNGGKIAHLEAGKSINSKVIKMCNEAGIQLPLCRNKRGGNFGKQEFVPFNAKHKELLGEQYKHAMSIWSDVVIGKKTTGCNSWRTVVPHLIGKVCDDSSVFADNDYLLAANLNGDFRVYTDKNDLLNYIPSLTDKSNWEIRCHQKNPIALYLGRF